MKKLWLGGALLIVSLCGCQSVQEREISPGLQEYVQVLQEQLTYEKLPQGATPTFSSVQNWSNEFKYNLLCVTPEYVSFEEQHYSYSGGAHGMLETRVGSLRVRDGHWLTLHDLFPTPVGRAKLERAWQKALLKHFKVTDWTTYLKQSDVWKPFVTENFYLDQKGVNLVYDPYEIACYAAGTIKLLLPWEELR